MKRIIIPFLFLSLFFNNPAVQADIDFCALLQLKNKRLRHHSEQLKNLNKLKSLVTEAKEIQQMLHRKGQLPGEYDGFDQVLINMQKEVNELVTEQRDDFVKFKNYSFGSIVLSLIVYKHFKLKLNTMSFNKAIADMAKNHKLKTSMIIASGVMIYLAYQNYTRVSANSQKIADIKKLLDKLNGLDIQQEEIDFLQGLILEDQEKLRHVIRLWHKQGKVQEAYIESDSTIFCR